jgi:hypothetical protein
MTLIIHLMYLVKSRRRAAGAQCFHMFLSDFGGALLGSKL